MFVYIYDVFVQQFVTPPHHEQRPRFGEPLAHPMTIVYAIGMATTSTPISAQSSDGRYQGRGRLEIYLSPIIAQGHNPDCLSVTLGTTGYQHGRVINLDQREFSTALPATLDAPHCIAAIDLLYESLLKRCGFTEFDATFDDGDEGLVRFGEFIAILDLNMIEKYLSERESTAAASNGSL